MDGDGDASDSAIDELVMMVIAAAVKGSIAEMFILLSVVRCFDSKRVKFKKGNFVKLSC